MTKKNTLQENRHHSNALVPFSYYKSAIPEFFPFVPMHSHSEWELNFITDGAGLFITDKTKITAYAGEIVLFFPHMLHAIETDTKIVYDTVVFNTDMLGSTNDRCFSQIISPMCNLSAELLHITSRNNYYKEMYSCASNIVSCAAKNSPQSDLLMKGELLRFLWYAFTGNSVTFNKKQPQSNEIREILYYINEHYNEPLTIEFLAAKAHLSKSWFMRKFHDTVGVGAIEYINKLRIQKVCEMLLDGNKIADAAFECGFQNLSNFNRLFKAVVGCTPREYPDGRSV